MKAVRIHQHGGREQLRYEDVPEPEPADGEVIVRLRACALNYRDLEGRHGWRGAAKIEMPLPQILGADGAGVVVNVGKGVDRVKVGDEVLLSFVLSCSHCFWCLNGEDYFCAQFGTIGITRPGTYAQYIRVPQANVVPKPPDLSFEEAASLGLVLHTAWAMMVTRAHVRAVDDVLVHAAGSGVGSAAIQIAKAFGCRVIATAGSEAKLRRARDIGADEVINYREQRFADEVLRLTDGRGVDLVADVVGGDVLVDSIRALARSGRLVTCASGSLTEEHITLTLTQVRQNRIELIFTNFGGKGELLQAVEFVRKGKIRPVIHQVLPLEDAAIAHQMLEERRQFGKVVLGIP